MGFAAAPLGTCCCLARLAADDHTARLPVSVFIVILFPKVIEVIDVILRRSLSWAG
jgi:hypothetical protein